MSEVRIVEPDEAFREGFLALLDECEREGDGWYIRYSSLPRDDFARFVAGLHERTNKAALPEGRVPDSHFWLVDGAGRVLGQSNLRHELNEYLREQGGHIGYHIRPSARRQGHATTLLALTLEKARALGLPRVLITANSDNVASIRVIRRNGGVLEDEIRASMSGQVVSRFWIELEPSSSSD